MPLLGAALFAAGGAGLPPRPVSVIVPDMPVGEAGTLARALQPWFEQALGQATIIDFRPGAGGIVGLTAGARAAADGTTLTLLTPAIAEAPWLTWRIDCTPSDFTCLGRLSFTPTLLCVRAESPFRQLGDLVSAMRADPGGLSTPAAGDWNAAELAQALFLARAGVTARRNTGLATGTERLAALRAGDIDLAFISPREALSTVGGAPVRPLAVSAPARIPEFPEVPSFREQGMDVALGAWQALAVPAGTPPSAIERLSAVVQTMMTTPELGTELARLGITPSWLGPDDTEQALLAEYHDAGALFASLGLSVHHPA